MHACATLVYPVLSVVCCCVLFLNLISKLEPGIPEAEQFEIAKVSTDHLLAVPFLSNANNKKVSDEAIKVCTSCVHLCIV